jgi:hypothetical protein
MPLFNIMLTIVLEGWRCICRWANRWVRNSPWQSRPEILVFWVFLYCEVRSELWHYIRFLFSTQYTQDIDAHISATLAYSCVYCANFIHTGINCAGDRSGKWPRQNLNSNDLKETDEVSVFTPLFPIYYFILKPIFYVLGYIPCCASLGHCLLEVWP